jgi:hypothetical protein
MWTVAMKWFNNLKVAQKLALASIFFMMPDSIMLYLFITGINENIHFARLEKIGNQYQRPLENLLDEVSRHRLLSMNAFADESRSQLADTQAKIDATFHDLALVDSELGATLQFTPEALAKRGRAGCDVTDVWREWSQLKANLPRLDSAAADRAHLQLIADIRGMIAHSGDMSNLILDPELDSYYMVDATLMALPQTQDRLAQTTVDGVNFLRSSQRSDPHLKTTLATELVQLKEDDLDRISSSVGTSLAQVSRFHGSTGDVHASVPPALAEYQQAASQFDDLLAKIRDGDSTVSVKQFVAAGEAARSASYSLWNIADDGLDGILQRRVDYYINRRLSSLGVSGAALAAAMFFITFITRSISGPLKRQSAELQLSNDALSAAREHLMGRSSVPRKNIAASSKNR